MKELSHGSFLPEDFSKKRSVLKRVAIRLVPVSVLVFAGCSGGGVGEKNSSSQELENRESGYSLPFPEGETWFLTNGPHADGSSNGVRNAIDIAPPEGGFCPPDGRKFTIDSRIVTASASGEVTIKGDDKNRHDPHHSEIRIKDKNGLTQVYVHLDRTTVKLGDKVNQGDPLGNPSCEYPPGGANTGPHVHIGVMKDGQAIPIDGVVVGGWTIHEGVDGKDGTMTKQGEKTRTANVGRYAENSTGIRNDLPNNPNKAVVASPKNPIPPISATITSKDVFTATATPPPSPAATEKPQPTPTPKPTETQKPTLTPQKEIPTPTPTVTPISTPTVIPTPRPKPTETPKPAAVEKELKSLEDQAKLLVLNNFLNLLSTTQLGKGVHDSKNNPTYILDSKIEHNMRASKADIIQGKQAQDSDRLLVRWNTSVLTEGRASKNLGEAEIKGMQMQLASQPITRAEQANGIQWKGAVQISYLTHSRFALPFFTDSYYGYSATKSEWAIAAPKIPVGLPFSPWTEQRWLETLILTNDRWTSSTDQDTRVLYPLDMYSIAGYDERSNPCVSTYGGSIPGCLELQIGPRPNSQIFESYRSPYKVQPPASWTLNSLHGGESEGEKYDSFTVDKPDAPHKFLGFADISQKSIHPNSTLESQTEKAIIKMMDLNLNSVGKERVNLTFSQAIIKITDRNVAGINARTVLTIAHTSDPPVYQSYSTFLIVKDADGSRKLWIIDFTYPHKDVSSDQAERINNQLLEGFELLPKSP